MILQHALEVLLLPLYRHLPVEFLPPLVTLGQCLGSCGVKRGWDMKQDNPAGRSGEWGVGMR